MIAKLFPELGEEVTGTAEAPHLKVALEQSDRVGVPGSRITLTAKVQLPPDGHVYAPGTKGYKPVSLVIDSVPELELKPTGLSAGSKCFSCRRSTSAYLFFKEPFASARM